MENDLGHFEYPQKQSTKKLWAVMCFTIFLNILAFQFFIISVSCFLEFFAGFLKIIAPGVGFKHDFSAPGSGIALSLWPRGGEFALLKIPRGFAGGWSGLELTDTSHGNRYVQIHLGLDSVRIHSVYTGPAQN